MRIFSALLIAAAATVSAGKAPDVSSPAVAQNGFSVPFEMIKGHIYVQGYVNGKGPYTFIFDTGASGMGRADVRLVAEHGLKKVGQEQNSDGINVTPIDIVKVASLRLGKVEKRNVELLSRDYNLNPSPDRPLILGIFGADFFADHLLTIDYPGRTLRFSQGELKKGEPGVFAYSGSFRVPVCFAKGCHTGMIDTGSNMSIVVPKSLVSTLSADPPIHVGRGRRANTVSEMYEMQLREPVRIGAVTVAGMKIRYADPSDDKINIGSNFLKDYVLTIDSRNKLLRIERPVAGERG